MKVDKSCPICRTPMGALGSSYDDRHGFPGRYPLFLCHSCGHIALGAGFTPAQITDLYSNYYPRSSLKLEDHRPYTERSGLLAWLDGARSSAFRWVPRSVRVLDIGCGFGESLGYHKSRGCDVQGVEADENIRRVAERYGYNVHVGLFEPERYEPESFDYVTMDQVLEHVQRPVDTLKGVAGILKRGGYVIVSVPNAGGLGASLYGKKWIHWHTPYHLQFFSLRSMNLLAEQVGLVVESTVTITSSEWMYYQWLHLFTRPPEGVPSQFWTGPARYSMSKKALIKLLGALRRVKVFHLLTRLVDAFSYGDNRLFLLRKP